MDMFDTIIMQPGSPAFLAVKQAVEAGRKVSISPRRDGVAVKAGESIWSPTLSTAAPERPEDDARSFKRGECGHLICQQCKGHKEFRETHDDDDEGDSWRSCICCKHCNDPRGH
jgi:hypothetical protein